MPINPAYTAAIAASNRSNSKFDNPVFRFAALGSRINGLVTKVTGPKALENKNWKTGDAEDQKTYLALILEIESKDEATKGQVFTHFLSGGYRWELLGNACEAADISEVKVGDAFMEARTDVTIDEKTSKPKWTHEIKVKRLPSA